MAFAAWANAEVTLWATEIRGVYTAKWFDRFAEAFRETQLTIVEESEAMS